MQEILITSSSHLKINGFKQINLLSSSPKIRGLSTLIRNDYCYSIMDCTDFSHTSVEIHGVQLVCSLDEPLYIFNIYRHPNTNTSLSFYTKIFAFATTHKYVLFLGDFNAHHSDWENSKTDIQGERISQACDAHHLVIMNDGSPTFQPSPNVAPSVIDLSIASRPLAILINQETSSDLHGSDHFPIMITIRDTYPTTYRFSHRHHLSPDQLSLTQDRLALRAPNLKEELSSQSAPTPIEKYDLFCQTQNEVISSVCNPKKNFLPHRKEVLNTKIPAPWWNSKCAEAVEHRSTMCRLQIQSILG